MTKTFGFSRKGYSLTICHSIYFYQFKVRRTTAPKTGNPSKLVKSLVNTDMRAWGLFWSVMQSQSFIFVVQAFDLLPYPVFDLITCQGGELWTIWALISVFTIDLTNYERFSCLGAGISNSKSLNVS